MPRLGIPQTLFFDWHGALADTFVAMYRAVEELLPQLGALGLEARLPPPGAVRGRAAPGPEVWFVGDSTTDVIAARQAGVSAIFYNGAKWDPLQPVRIFPPEHPPDAITGNFASGALLVAPLARAQPAARVFKVGILTTAGTRGQTPFYVALEERFRELGYAEGKNLALDWHSATGRLDKIPDLAAALARNRPDVVLATGSEIVLREIRGTVGTTPIVMVAIDYDPLARNFIASLSSPGGNITGLFLLRFWSSWLGASPASQNP